MAVKHILGEPGVEVQNYIDDIFAATEGKQGEKHLRAVCELIEELGLPLNKDTVQGYHYGHRR